MLAPKSNKTYPISNVPIVTGIVKLLGSLYFDSKDFRIIVLHPASNFMVSSSKNILFFVNIYFINLAYVVIFSKASRKGLLICN